MIKNKMMPIISRMPFERFVVKPSGLQRQYIIFYRDGTCYVYGEDYNNIKIPKEYYDQMLQFVRHRWGEDYTPNVRIYTMDDAIKKMREMSNRFMIIPG